ncbi:Uncharacterized protein OBRU01_21831, partial [Operophtera brumata]
MVDQLEAVAGKDTFSLWKYLILYTMDSVCETALGIKVDAQRNPNQPFLKAFDQFCQIVSWRMFLPPFIQKMYKYLPINTLYMKNIDCMWEYVDKASGGASGFTNLELREETLVLLLAGSDTSAVGSAFTSLMLARHPEVQNKVYEESVSAEDLPRLKYLEAVIKESLRLYPPVPIIVRKADKDIKLPNGLELPKGTSFMINIWAVHRNPVYWGKDAEEFRPERFLESNLKHPAAFIPFSYGPRSCLGYQYAMISMKTAVACLVRHYRLSTSDSKQAPLRVKFDIMMKHVDNFELQMERRS